MAMQAITKVVIPVAGLGTRFLPVTKAQPKEMLPVVDKPVIQYIVEEAVASGMTDIILVTGGHKRAIEDHFDSNRDLEELLISQGKGEAAAEIRRISQMANFIYIRQKGPYGNGTPVLNAAPVVGDEPFAVLFGDDIFVGAVPRLRQLLDVYAKYQHPVLTAVEVTKADTSRYGIIDGVEVGPGILQVNRIVEKPGPELAPSTTASIGGYVLTPDIFDVLRSTPLGKNNELWLADALATLQQQRPVYACRVNATFYDTGSVTGWLQANIAFALQKPELAQAVRAMLHDM